MTPTTTLFRVSRRRAADEVRNRLIELIETGRIKVGEQLPAELELARSFGVSRSVIREALVGLAALGLTASHSGKGTFVAAIRSSLPLLQGRYAARHLYEIRLCLEVPAARSAARQRSVEDIEAMEALLEAFENEPLPAERNKLDAQFHIAIAESTGNPLFAKLIEDLRATLEDQSLAVSVLPGRQECAAGEHRAIFAAIAQRDADAAGLAMMAHLEAVEVSFRELRTPVATRHRPPTTE